MQKLQKLTEKEYFDIQKNAKQYIEKNYRWDIVEQKLIQMIGKVE